MISASVTSPELAVVAIFRDEARFLKEWIEYYRLQGVDKFYLYNNLSVDNYQSVLSPYIQKGIVELYEWDQESNNAGDFCHIQCLTYKDGMEKARRDGISWLVVIDIDEFMVPIVHDTLLDVVHSFDQTNVGMISALWMMFGTSNVKEVPNDRLMIETLLYNGGIKSIASVKSILHTQRAETNGPHYGHCKPGYTYMKLPTSFMQIFHYWSRDEKFFYEVKIPRWDKWGWRETKCIELMNSFNNPENIEYALPIMRYLEALREIMGLNSNELLYPSE